MQAGLLDKTYIKEIKMSSTYKDDTFANEYLGQWTGGGSDSWFDYEKMSRYRKLINPEAQQNIRVNGKEFYIISVDVGRISCQTVLCVFKVFPQESEFKCNLVNIYVIGKRNETRDFFLQSLEIKRIVHAFQPKELVFDANGLGIGLLDILAHETVDPLTGQVYPGYSSLNLDTHSKRMYPKNLCIVYGVKSNSVLQSKIDANCYTRVFSGKVQFLVKEQEIKSRLMKSVTGQKMKIEKRVARLMPHELTTRLFEEMANLRVKGVGNDIKLEQINTNMLKDKFSAFEYGLWRIKELEDEYYKKIRSRQGKRTLFFYN